MNILVDNSYENRHNKLMMKNKTITLTHSIWNCEIYGDDN